MTDYRPQIERAAKAHSLDPNLLEALVVTESSGRADAFRHEPGYYRLYIEGRPQWAGRIPRRVASSYGLTQIMYPTALQYGFNPNYEPEMLFLPEINLNLGAKILAALLKRFNGDVEQALQAYNGGPNGVGRPAPVAYAKKVATNLSRVADARA